MRACGRLGAGSRMKSQSCEARNRHETGMRRASLEVGWGSVGVPAGVCLIVDQSRICGRFELPASTQSHAGHRWEQGRRPMCVCAVRCGGCERYGANLCVHCVRGWKHMPLHGSYGLAVGCGEPGTRGRCGESERGCVWGGTKEEAAGKLECGVSGWCGVVCAGVPAASIKLGCY